MSAVAAPEEPPAEAVVARPDSTVLFMSRRSELRLVRKARQPLFGPGGAKQGELPGETVEFRDGVLRLPHEGRTKIADGRMADAAELIVWLDEHPLHGDVAEGFWRVDPTAPPLAPEEAQAIARAARRLELERLGQLLEAERTGWAREPVIALMVETIEEVKDGLAKQDELVAQRVAEELAQRGEGKQD